MKREYYSDSIAGFLGSKPEDILGRLVMNSDFSVEQTQRDAWLKQIDILKSTLAKHTGTIYFEYSIPRMGKRIDVVLIVKAVIFVIEFKVDEKEFTAYATDQVWDYALDLKNFHEISHNHFIAPILVATKAKDISVIMATTPQTDNLSLPIKTNVNLLGKVIDSVLLFAPSGFINREEWEKGRYQPTPTISSRDKSSRSSRDIHLIILIS